MPDQLMSEQRQQDLMKVAEETIGLMNIGVDGEAALRKLSEDKLLNDHEVELVAHAVNNSKQLHHLQTAAPEDREKTFEVINAKNITKKDERPQPATNAEGNSGDRYAPQETMGDSTAQKQDAPDAPEIHKELLDKAAESHQEYGDYRKKATTVDYAAILRDGWGLAQKQSKVAEYIDPNPYAKLGHTQIAIEEARLRESQCTYEALGTIQKVAERFRHVGAPAFEHIEKIATQLGVATETMDLIYRAGALDKFGEKRATHTKVASRMYVSQSDNDLAELCVHADTMWKTAANAAVEMRQAEEAHKKVAQRVAALAGSMMDPADNMRFDLNPSSLEQPLARAPQDYSGLGETREEQVTTLSDALGSGGGADAGELKSFEEGIPLDVRQGLRNTDTRAAIEGLMEDDFIGGHSLPDVIEAYNAAMSVNPAFGRAQLVSYMRQHLATEGGVPLDLQMRASKQYEKGSDE